jgi:hypothetical protein
MAPNFPNLSQLAVQSSLVKEVIARLAKIGIRVADHVVVRELGNPRAVEFKYGDMIGLRVLANGSDKLVLDNLKQDGRDDWLNDNISILVGYTECNEIGKNHIPMPLHIDIPVNRPNLFRAFLLGGSQYSLGDIQRRAKIEGTDKNGVYRKIADRMAWNNPPFDLDSHVADIIRIGNTTLDGVDFVPRDARKLEIALQSMTLGARRRFAWPHSRTIASGATDFSTGKGVTDNLTFDVSLGATEGSGYREIFDRAQAPAVFQASSPIGESAADRMYEIGGAKFSGAFSDYVARPDISALHCAVSASKCNIHIDETAVCIYDESGKMIVSGNAGQHTGDELLWKTYGPKLMDVLFSKAPVLHYLPMNRIPEVVDLRIPSPANGYRNFSLEAFMVRKKSLTLSLKYSCAPPIIESVTGQDYFRKVPGVEPQKKEWAQAITFNIAGTHDIGDGGQ